MKIRLISVVSVHVFRNFAPFLSILHKRSVINVNKVILALNLKTGEFCEVFNPNFG